MKNNALIIKLKGTDVFPDNSNNIAWYYNCNIKNPFFRFFRKFNIPLISIFYGNWKKKLKDFNTVILFDSGCNDMILKYIKRKNRNIKIIYWYWNSLIEHNYKVVHNELIDEIWTYNRFDAEKYNLKYNPQFYLKKYKSIISETSIDVLFVGTDKGRESGLLELESKLNEIGISSLFKIIKNKKDFLEYNDYLKLLFQSKCVLDYSFVLPSGLSLRPLESLFYEKKLITNNSDIKKYKFYNPNNIFIIGEDKIDDLYNFINSPYEKISDDIIQYHSYYSWIKRFEE